MGCPPEAEAHRSRAGVPAPKSSDILRSPKNTFPVERPSSQLRLPPIKREDLRTDDVERASRRLSFVVCRREGEGVVVGSSVVGPGVVNVTVAWKALREACESASGADPA
eukprot:scaffold10698_cov112-Isochrysis_galbana.AAC.3